jgi:hypothetical protein
LLLGLENFSKGISVFTTIQKALLLYGKGILIFRSYKKLCFSMVKEF